MHVLNAGIIIVEVTVLLVTNIIEFNTYVAMKICFYSDFW